MPSRRVEFAGALGEQLAARFDRAENERFTALFAHCFTCSKDALAASRISRSLNELGVSVLRFDFTGLGGSDGEFANTTFSSNIGDLLAACDWLREHAAAPGLLIGHSLGGAAVLACAASVPECKAVATIGAPGEPAHVRHLLGDGEDEIAAAGSAQVSIGGRPFTIRREFLEDLERHEPSDYIGSLRRALMIFHSPIDSIVGVDSAAQIFQWARHPKSFISLDTADHMLSRSEDAEFVAAVLSAWSRRYLPGQ